MIDPFQLLMHDYKTVWIEWIDASAMSPWVTEIEIEHIDKTVVLSLGKIVRITMDFVVLAQSEATEGDEVCYGNVIVIPKGMITKIGEITINTEQA